MWRIALASALISLSVQASHLDNVCKMMSAPSFADGFLTRFNVLENLEGQLIFENHVRLKGVIRDGDKLWVLASNSLIQMNKDGSGIEGFEMDKNISMAKAQDLILVVRGGGAISAFNTKTKEIAWTSYLNEVDGGEAVSVTFDGTNALVVMTGTREGGFNGVATMNLEGKVIKTAPYDNVRAGVIDPEAIAHWHNGNLILNNGGWIHVITPKQISSGKKFRPRWVALQLGSGMSTHYMMLKGDFYFEGNTLVGCGLYNEHQDGDIVRAGGLFKVSLP